MKRAREAHLLQRIQLFRRLIIWPVIVAGVALAGLAADARGCLPAVSVVFAAASLELLAAYYIAGTIVGTRTWLRSARSIAIPVMARLWALGTAGAASAMLIAGQLLAWRCR
ncbi:hypothetical protein GCM10011380_36170 [Sphingomonas metalli]|uniref:Uncharacterized protein n=1 Tax=Sphingomonas metalli TaxID=1779358 RepID=A0A916WYE4_9SPHN|nr:hypothetical protein GCM10011380_36170 [Sphingomonas metalli]